MKLIHSQGYRGDHVSDTESAIIAFSDRAAEGCRAEITSQEDVKADKQTKDLIENAVMQLRGIIH